MRASRQLKRENKSKILKLFSKQGVFFTPDIVEHDMNATVKPWFDLILGSNNMKKIGDVSDFWTIEVTPVEISLPMRNIQKLETHAQIDKSWTVNNSIYQDMSKEPQRTLKPT